MAMGACDILSEQVFRIVLTILKTCSDNMSHAPMAMLWSNMIGHSLLTELTRGKLYSTTLPHRVR